MRLVSISFVRIRIRQLSVWRPAILVVMFAASCSGSQQSIVDADSIVVEGIVSVRGNEPFTGLMLVTDDRNSYILIPPDRDASAEIRRRSPGRFRVSGIPYKEIWQGKEYAHLRVLRWDRLDS